MPSRNTAKDELDLVPIMNLVTILIPFLLFSATFVSLGAIETTVPGIVDQVDVDPPPSLELSVTIDHQGYVVGTGLHAQPDPDWTLPRDPAHAGPDSWDTTGLVRILAELKEEHPQEDTVILVPASDVSYDVLIHTMDATAGRLSDEPLFPAVVVAGGAT
ncbi:MAG: biopolymer transporter ExbD [Myxococcales bacterium]|nr:biopolymer transporter ExbD [Myxococcales bacterium]